MIFNLDKKFQLQDDKLNWLHTFSHTYRMTFNLTGCQRRPSCKCFVASLVESFCQELYYKIMLQHLCGQHADGLKALFESNTLNQTKQAIKEWRFISHCAPWCGRYWEHFIDDQPESVFELMTVTILSSEDAEKLQEVLCWQQRWLNVS